MPRRADHPGKAWCYQHECHPDDCFEEHRPDVRQSGGALSEAEHRELIIREHIRQQEDNIRAVADRMSRDPEELRQEFERKYPTR